MSQGDFFNLKEGKRRKQEGMDLAALAKPTLLLRCQIWARKYAEQHGYCNADIVAAMLDANNLPQLGCAAGSLFKERCWIHRPGDTIPSARPRNHAHHIRNWRLKP